MTRHSRGAHLLAADRGFAVGAGIISWMLAPGFGRVLDRIGAGLGRGSITVELPSGQVRVLGGRAPGPAARVTLSSWRALVRLVTAGSVGWYRAWMAGEWRSPDPVTLFELFSLNRHTLGASGRAQGPGRLLNRIKAAARRNDKPGARRNIAFHYDLGNDFYAPWLDATMTYSSALFAAWPSKEPLEDAQVRKMRVLLDRLDLKPDDRLLEIGCGWGSLSELAAREYGVRVVAITLSEEQASAARARIAAAGLTGRVDVRLADYRDVTERFDAIASVEMVEAVGREYWADYLRAVSRCLEAGGRAAIQFISIDDATFASYAENVDFIQTYIFPGGMLVSEAEFRAHAEAAGLSWRDRQGFGRHYAETLRRWRERFDSAFSGGRLPAGFDEAFARLWRYYLMYCEGGFRGEAIDVAQVTLVKG